MKRKITLFVAILISINALATINPPCTPPLITVNPISSSVCSGVAQVSFSVLAAFDTTLTYQWQVNQGTGFINLNSSPPYLGVTQSTLNITGITTALSGYLYRCVVSIDTCISISNAATLTVTNCTNCTPPVITVSPYPISICEGSMASFSITTNAPTPSYQWQVNQGAGFANLSNMPPYSGVTMPILNITGVTAIMNGYQFRCRVSSDTCSSISNAAILTVTNCATCTPPTITVNPMSNSACAGSLVSFSMQANGTALIYQWQVNHGTGFTNLNNGPPYGSVTANVLNISSVSTALNGQYRCVVSSDTCTRASNAASLTVTNCSTCTPPVITTSPTPVSTCTGMNAMFSVMASGTNITYQWQVNQGAGFTNISGFPPYAITTTGQLTISSVPPAFTGYQYRCVVSSDTCRSTSNAAILTVSPAITVTVNSPTINSGQTAVLTATGATSYSWILAPPPPPPLPPPAPVTINPISVSPTTTTTYTVTGTTNGCSNTAFATVTVISNGTVGATGATGATGTTGTTGTTGAIGATGTDGIQGANGLTGATGAMGATGADGIQGATGQQGIQGETGIIGTQGIQGNTGAAGIMGATGADGALSAWGKGGTAGTNPSIDFLGTTDATGLAFRTNNIERIRILPTGSIGIGTTTPITIGKVVQVSANDANGTSMLLENTVAGGKNWRMLSAATNNTGGAGSFMIVNHTDDPANPKLLITPSGNIGMGTATPNAIGKTLHIASTATGGTSLFLENTKSWRVLSTGTGNTGGGGNLLIVNHSDDAANPKFMISTSGNVGIGTIAPSAKLDVNGNAKVANDLTVGGNLNFGGNHPISYQAASGPYPAVLGWGTPTYIIGPILQLPFCVVPTQPTINMFSGMMYSYGNNANGGQLNVMRTGFDGANGIIDVAGINDIGNGPNLLINYYCGKDVSICTGANGGNISMSDGSNGGNIFMCTGNNGQAGAVAIGTTTIPQGYKLAVKGKIICEEVKVKSYNTWPDYVFDKKYKLMSIEELQEFTKNGKHLPDMPTAADVEKNGINISEMITKLLKTQEEQTQYIFQLNEQNKELKKEIEKIKKK